MFFKRIKFLFLVIKAFIAKQKKIIILSIIVGLVGFLIITFILPYLPEPKKNIRVGIVGNYTFAKLPLKIRSLLSQGLTAVDQSGKVKPGLAKEWQISPNGLVYTFILKDKLFWQNGQKLKAYDLNYSFKDVKKKVINEKKIQFTLKEPFAPFLISLSKPVFKEGYIGAGKYAVKKIKKNNDFIEILIISGPEKEITFRFYPTVESAVLGFKLGEVDVLEDLFSNPLTGEWEKFLTIKKQLKKDSYVALFFNNKDKLLGSKLLRQALSYAVAVKPKDESRAYGPLNPNSWAFNPEIKKYDYNQEKAKELFKKFNQDSKEKLVLKISTSPSLLALAEAIKQSWQELLPVTVTVEAVNYFDPQYQIFLGVQKIPLDPDQYSLWHSTSPNNIIGFNDLRIDKLLEDGRKILDWKKRKEKYYDFQKFLLEEAPVVFLYHPATFTISRKSIAYP